MTQASSTVRQVSVDDAARTTRVMRTRVFRVYTVQRVLALTGKWMVPVCLLLLALGFNIFSLGQQFLGSPAGLIAASLYLLNDLQLIYAQQARSYSLQLLLICLAWYAFLRVLTVTSRQGLWWLCFSVATTLAIYAHLFSLV